MSTETMASDPRQLMLDTASALGRLRTTREASEALCAAVFDLVTCARARSVFVDTRERLIWTEGPGAAEGELSGLIAQAVRTGAPCVIERGAERLVYDDDADDRGGAGVRLLVHPIAGSREEVHAVLVLVRDLTCAPFSSAEAALIRKLAEYTAPMLDHLAHVIDAEQSAPNNSLFRQEALAEHSTRRRRSDAIRITPNWIAPVSWFMLAVLLAALTFVLVARVHRYSTGVAAIRAGDRSAVVALEAGTLAAIAVRPGDRVKPGQVLARLDDHDAIAELERAEAQHLAALRDRMRDPESTGTSRSIVALAAELDNTRARARRREIRAPHAGTVADVRVFEGQAVRPGDVVVTLGTQDADFAVVAFVPGDDRPRIRPGMHLRFDLPGYAHEPLWCPITSVGDAVVSPGEAARQLGPEIAGVVLPAGPSVLVRATVPGRSFQSGDEEFHYHDGMYGTAEVRLGHESLLRALLPGISEAVQ